MVALTIGMATYDDFDGVYFTLQALRLYQDLLDTELLVVDRAETEIRTRHAQSEITTLRERHDADLAPCASCGKVVGSGRAPGRRRA